MKRFLGSRDRLPRLVRSVAERLGRAALAVVTSLPLVACSGERADEESLGEPARPIAVAPAPGRIDLDTRRDAQPSWAIPYGAEFWRRSPGDAIGEAVERVSLALEASGSGIGLRSNARRFEASFDGDGVTLSFGFANVATRVRTRSVRSGDRAVYAGEGGLAYEALGNTAQAELATAPEVVEHFQVRNEGVELAWVVKSEPPEGDLTIELEFEGLTLVAESSGAWLGMDATGGTRLRVGETWLVDRNGRRALAQAAASGATLRLVAPADFVATATFPIAVDPTIGPAFELDTATTPTFVNEWRPRAAHIGPQALIVWAQSTNQQGIRGTRLRLTDGAVLDVNGHDFGAGSVVEVLAHGGNYVVFKDSVGTYFSRVVAQTYGTDLSAIGSAQTIWNVGQSGFQPDRISAASDGSGYVMTLQEHVSNNTYGHVVAVPASGVPGAAVNIPVTAGPFVRYPAIAFDGSSYYLVWEEGGDYSYVWSVRGSRVRGSDGALQDTPVLLAPAMKQTRYPSIGCGGGECLAAWANGGAVEGRTIAPGTGTISNPISIKATDTLTPSGVSVTGRTTGGYLVAWRQEDASTVQFRATRYAGGVTNPGGILFGSSARGSGDLGAYDVDTDDVGSGNVLVTYMLPRNIYAHVVQNDGSSRAGYPVVASIEEPGQTNPTIASTAQTYLVAWEKTKGWGVFSTERSIFAARLRSDNLANLDPSGLSLCSGAAGDRSLVRAGTNGSDFLLSWSVGSAIEAMRVRGSDGVPLDSTCLPLASSGGYSDVAGSSTKYLVAWDAPEATGSNHDLKGRMVDAASGALGGVIDIAVGTPDDADPEVASDGNAFFVAWRRGVVVGSVQAAFLDASGAVSAPVTVLGSVGLLDAAYGGGHYFTAIGASPAVTGVSYDAVTHARTGSWSLGSTSYTVPIGVASSGPSFLALWPAGSPYDRIDSRRVHPTLGPIEPAPVTLFGSAAGTESFDTPAAASHVANAYLVAAVRRSSAALSGTPRTRLEMVTFGTCSISGLTYEEGQHDAQNGCHVCDPARSAAAWSNESDALPCNDGQYCTVNDACSAGACVGAVRDCSAFGNACNVGTCNEANDRCVADPAPREGRDCDDGLFCNDGETCQAGVCTGGAPHDCSVVGDACKVGTCDEASDRCFADPVPREGQGCDDGLFCNDGEMCQAGVCTGGTAHDCSVLGDACNVGTCDEANDRCFADPAPREGQSCPDNLYCTVSETCRAGKCETLPRSCSVLDGPCVVGTCNESAQTCVPDPGPRNGAACSDGNACNGSETCSAGTCGTDTPLDCDDHDSCTRDSCTPDSGCRHEPTAGCSDGGGAGGAAGSDSGAAGTSGSGGLGGSGGSTGGSGGGTGGAAGSAGGSSETGDANGAGGALAPDQGGCGCRTSGGSSSSPASLAAVVLLGALRRRRARDKSRASCVPS